MIPTLTIDHPIATGDDGTIWQATIGYLEHHPQPVNDPRWSGTFAAIDWSRVPETAREALRPFVLALADLLLADLLRYPPGTV